MSEVYAKGTKVPEERSRLEIETLLERHKARSTAVFREPNSAAVAFEMSGRRVLFRIALPSGKQNTVARTRRERWRALLLAIKAKLVSVEAGIETFEEAFMAHVVMPDGRTVSEHVAPRIDKGLRVRHHAAAAATTTEGHVMKVTP